MRETADISVAAPDEDRPATADDGRIPFRLRVGVTGHRRLTVAPPSDVSRELDRIGDMLRGHPNRGPIMTEVRLAVVSQLAEGADRLVVRQVFDYCAERRHDARLEVILPMHRTQYIDAQSFSDQSRHEFERLLKRATFIIEPPSTGREKHRNILTHTEEYVAAAKKLINRCDVLIAVWDGQSSLGKRGGSAHTLLNAAAQGKPCVWIPSDGRGEPQDNLKPGSSRGFFEEVKSRSALHPDYDPDPETLDAWSLKQVSRAFSAFDQFNREPRLDGLGDRPASRMVRATSRLLYRAVDPHFAQQFPRKLGHRISDQLVADSPPALAAPSGRANLLAEHYQMLFRLFCDFVLVFAALAAVMLATGVALRTESWLWPALECLFLGLAFAGFTVARRLGFHRRWLSYRILAERLRTALYIAPTGIDLRDQVRLQGAVAVTESEEWLMRAFEEVWDHIRGERKIADRATLKRLLADDWIQGQINYHEKANRKHQMWHSRLSRILWFAFLSTLVFAALDAVLAGSHACHWLQSLSRALTIALPVIGASLGAAITIHQHRALAERSGRMQLDLRLVKQDVEAAADPRTLQDATIAATRLIAPETGTWFGALWFLDIEHP